MFQPFSMTHKKCFICGRQKEKLFVIKLASINYAYKKHRIVINEGSRICGRHLDETRLIKPDEFKKIPTKKLI